MRPADGRTPAGVVRSSPARRKALIAALLATALLAVAGCGGDDLAYEESPGAPTLTLPEGAPSAAADNTDTDADADADADATPTPTATPAGGATTGAATPTPTPAAGGGTANQGGTTSTTGGTSAPQGDQTGGSGNERFDDFCEQNPGAC